MTFFQRFKRFLISLLIGILLSVAFFNDKVGVLTGWTPTNRVKARVIESYYTPDATSDCFLLCNGMSWDSLLTFVPDASVDFKASQRRVDPKEFELNFEDTPMLSTVRFAVQDSSVWIADMMSSHNCNCD